MTKRERSLIKYYMPRYIETRGIRVKTKISLRIGSISKENTLTRSGKKFMFRIRK